MSHAMNFRSSAMRVVGDLGLTDPYANLRGVFCSVLKCCCAHSLHQQYPKPSCWHGAGSERPVLGNAAQRA